MKNLIAIIIILSLTVACRASSLEVTEYDFFKDIKGWKGLQASNNGRTLTTNSDKYNFVEKKSAWTGLYKKENGTGDEYMLIFPLGDIAQTVIFNEAQKKGLDDIINIAGKENEAAIIFLIFSDNEFNADNMVAKCLSPEKKNNINSIINNLNLTNNKFGKFKQYPETN